jgi:hypothetical protein
MALPSEVRIGITLDGLSFDLCVRAFDEGSRRLFPEQEAADAIRRSPDLPKEAVRAAAFSLDAAVAQFLPAFEAALCDAVRQEIDS